MLKDANSSFYVHPLRREIAYNPVPVCRQDHQDSSLYCIKYDGFISDPSGFCAIGGNVEDVESVLRNDYRDAMPAGEAAALARRALSAGAERSTELEITSLEVCLLDRAQLGRKFSRLSTDEVQSILDS